MNSNPNSEAKQVSRDEQGDVSEEEGYSEEEETETDEEEDVETNGSRYLRSSKDASDEWHEFWTTFRRDFHPSFHRWTQRIYLILT